MNYRLAGTAIALCLASAPLLGNEGDTKGRSHQHKKVTSGDNTALNSNPKTPTAENQGNSAKDTEITAKIRRSITRDSSLSTYAHNVKIITNDGAVQLVGPVRTEQEKQTVIAKAQEIAGPTKVTNDINVVPDK